MKEDYLWNKTGSDPEIENLENVLKAFRLKDAAPPELPAKVFVLDKNFERPGKRRNIFRLAFTAFAVLGLVVFSAGIFQILKIEKTEVSQNDAKNVSSKIKSEDFAENSQTTTENVAPEKKRSEKPILKKSAAAAKPQIERRPAKLKKQIPAQMNVETVAEKIKTPKPLKSKSPEEEILLTEEEQYAYDQLMNALAITSSKFKLVRDKVQGIEKKEIVY